MQTILGASQVGYRKEQEIDQQLNEHNYIVLSLFYFITIFISKLSCGYLFFINVVYCHILSNIKCLNNESMIL